MECLDANVVQDLMSGALDAGTRGAVLGHLDTCGDCRELLGVTARATLRENLVDDGPQPAVDALAATTLPAIALAATMASVASPVRADTAQPSAGQPLGRYSLVDKLGAGAMGVVWRAEDPKLGRRVALKLLRHQDEALTERLVREAQAMAQVSHPNVVAVYDVGTTGGATYIAMELVEGQSLRAWQTGTRHTVPELVEAYLAAGRGLAAAHAAGIVHRDFKPDNVLVGDDDRVRVTDFGLAAAKPSQGIARPQIGDVNLTTAGSVLGTPAYMAPEQFSNGNVDSRTDQFNFCVALYEALYGERPFVGKTFEELGANVCAGRVRPAPARTRVSRGLRAIVLRGMSVKPGERFPTMEALITQLGRDRARPWRRTAIAAVALAAALGLGLVADWAVRDRVAGEIHQSFAATGKQLERAARQLADEFDNVSQIAYREQALREVAGHHDQADFGLGSPEADREELEKLHTTLESTDWVILEHTQLAIADYKGRLLYTSAAPSLWGRDLKGLPPIKRALDAGKGDSVTVMPYARLVGSGLVGATTPTGLAVLYERTLSLQSEARALYLELKDGMQLLDDIRLDDTLLVLVAPDGTTIGDRGISPQLVAAARSEIGEVTEGGRSYQVQAREVPGFAGQGPIAKVVMARPLDGVLSLFPGARTVFVVAALGALAIGILTALRARRITGALI